MRDPTSIAPCRFFSFLLREISLMSWTLNFPSLSSFFPLRPPPSLHINSLPKTKTLKKKKREKGHRERVHLKEPKRGSVSSRSNSTTKEKKYHDFGGSAKHGRTHKPTPNERAPPPPPPLPSRGVFLAIFRFSQFQRELTDEGMCSGLVSVAC